jgi:hypothetical protein
MKKLYYLHESAVLKRYEQRIASRWPLLTVTQSDADAARQQYQAKEVMVIPVFLPYQAINSPQGTGCYCLYHGNLSVEENEKAVCWLLEHVFNDLNIPFIIAGKKPSQHLRRAAGQVASACVIADPTGPEMEDIIRKAQLHVIPSFNCTGIKLKLLNALFNGRHCVVNEDAVEGTGLKEVCHVAHEAGQFKDMIEMLFERPFTLLDVQWRSEKLLIQYNNQQAAAKLIQRIW